MNRRDFLVRLAGILPATLLAEEVLEWPIAENIILHGRYLDNDLYTTQINSNSIIDIQQDMILVDTSDQPITVVLPAPQDIKHGITVKKVDGSSNPIQIICESDEKTQISMPYGMISLAVIDSKYLIVAS